MLPPGEIISSYGLYDVKDIKKMSNNKKIGAVALQTSLQMTRSLQTSCLTQEGFNRILDIKAGMNRGRV